MQIRSETWTDDEVLLFKNPDDLVSFCKYNGLKLHRVSVTSDIWLLGFIDNGNTYTVARIDDLYED